MRGFWAKIWRSPTRATLAGAILSALIASILYGFNWHTFYDTRTNFAETRAELIARDIATLAVATNAAPGNDDKFRKNLSQYLSPRRQLITVSRVNSVKGEDPEWSQTNGIAVDESRTLMAADFELEVAAGPDDNAPLHVDVRVGIRPRFVVALTRAWSFSILDYLDNPQRWSAEALYNRSIPLYGYLLTILIVGFGTIRAFYRDQQDLIRLEREAYEVAAELDQLREQHSEEIAVFRIQIDHTENQRDDAVKRRNRLTDEIAGIEREYQELIDTSPATNVDDTRLQETAERKTQVERVLASYNAKVAHYEHELTETRSELDAAEQLLQEVEDRREDLDGKLYDRNRKIRKLQGVIKETQKEIRNKQSDQLRVGKAHLQAIRESEKSQDTIEEQLGYWIKTGGHARVNFSRHSKVEMVEQQFQKIDPGFVDHYFTHVNNSEYERGSRRLIRVIADAGRDIDFTGGKLIIALDDDAGRTLGMHFETRKDAPNPLHIGFVLALLLRSNCKDFHSFSIRTQL